MRALALGDDAFESHGAGAGEHCRAIALDVAVELQPRPGAAGEELRQARLAVLDRRAAQILAVDEDQIECPEERRRFDAWLLLRRSSNAARPSAPAITTSPSIRKCSLWSASAAATIAGKRSAQSWPLRVKSGTRPTSRQTMSRLAVELDLVDPVVARRRRRARARLAGFYKSGGEGITRTPRHGRELVAGGARINPVFSHRALKPPHPKCPIRLRRRARGSGSIAYIGMGASALPRQSTQSQGISNESPPGGGAHAVGHS